jgi:hypothetical protein
VFCDVDVPPTSNYIIHTQLRCRSGVAEKSGVCKTLESVQPEKTLLDQEENPAQMISEKTIIHFGNSLKSGR